MIHSTVEGYHNLLPAFQMQRVVEVPDGLDGRDKTLVGIGKPSFGIKVAIVGMGIVGRCHAET